jgi:O-antigen/teichoic acid export membrane protein
MLNSAVLTGLSYVFRGTLSKFITGSEGHGNLLFLAQFFSHISYYYLTYFKNSEVANRFVIYTIGASLINLIVSLVLVAYLHIGVIGIIYAQVYSGAILFGILSYVFITTFTNSFSKEILVGSVRISYPLTPRIFLGVIGTQINKYMIGLLASVGGVGIYSIGEKVSYMIFAYMTAIQNVFSPQVYKRMFDLEEKGGEAIDRYLTPFVTSENMVLLKNLFHSKNSKSPLFDYTRLSIH